LYGISRRQEQDNSSDVVTDIIKVFSSDIFALFDPGRVDIL